VSTFKYYKRGKGELDTSNFPELLQNKYIEIEELDSKAFVSLLAFNHWLDGTDAVELGYDHGNFFTVKVYGYIHHMRSDKDLFSPAKLYCLMPNLMFDVRSIQHESTPVIQSAKITQTEVLKDLPMICPWFTTFVGADGSVPKFMPTIEHTANKVRENGKVVSTDFTVDWPKAIKRIVIVDDLLGGGATIQMLVDTIKNQGYKGEVYLWVAYNEGIHKSEFLDQFNGVFIGKTVGES
jgi:hypothetical protein